MKEGLPSAMHEDSYASDMSNLQGPVPENARAQYFQVKEKGGEFSGMCPSFAFIDEYTMVTLSFSRKNTTLFLMKSFSLGLKNYDQKVFNNIWATYTFGPNNSIYIGAYRGFLKFSSDPKPE
jgi:hypothetical protein